MAGSAAVARALVDYDARLADLVLRVVASELGVAPDGEVQHLHAELQHVVADGSTNTTVEWKAGFAHVERLRTLGLELAKLLERVD